MPKIAYINSKYIKFNEAKIHIEDRGLQFADSVYEVVAIYKKHLVDFDFHIKRLKFSLAELSIKYKINKKNIHIIFKKLIKKNQNNLFLDGKFLQNPWISLVFKKFSI